MYIELKRVITEQDMKMSGDLTEENKYGQRSDTMAWFWRLDNGLSKVDQLSPCMKECELLLLPSISSSCHDLDKVYRISWLRAKARYTWWKEEHLLVRHKMQWTVSWFEYHWNMWQRQYEEIDDEASADGLQCYALKQAHLWENLKHHSRDTFNVSLPDVDKIWYMICSSAWKSFFVGHDDKQDEYHLHYQPIWVSITLHPCKNFRVNTQSCPDIALSPSPCNGYVDHILSYWSIYTRLHSF